MCSWKIKSNNNIILGDVLKNLSWSIKYLNYFQMHVFILSWCRNILRLDAKVVIGFALSQIHRSVTIYQLVMNMRKEKNLLMFWIWQKFIFHALYHTNNEEFHLYIYAYFPICIKNFPIHREIEIEIKKETYTMSC